MTNADEPTRLLSPAAPEVTRHCAIAADGGSVRVAIFSDAFPERNGTGAYYHDLVPQLEGKVAALSIFQPRFDSARRPFLSIAMPGDPQQRLVTPPVREVRTACEALQPTIVVVVTPGLFGLLGVYEARRRDIPLMCAFHTDFEQLARMYWDPIPRFFVNLVLRSANRIVCGASRSVLINNRDLQDDVRGLGAKRVDVIGTPLPREFLNRPPTPIADRLERVCFAGRLAPEKNVEQIIDAARRLPEIEFLIGGDGPLGTKLKQYAADCPNVRLLGWLSRDQLVDLIDSSTLLLLPSAFETFGSIALEAMARGRPALVSLHAGIHAWPALRGGLFTLNDPQDLATQLATLQSLSAADWQERSHQAREAAAQLNTETVDHWLQLLLSYQRPPLPEVA